jgi:UPF0755 protein
LLRVVRTLVVTLLLLAALGTAALVGGRWWLERYLTTPGPLAAETTVLIPRGAGLGAIASRLVDAGAIDDDLVFRGVAMVLGRDRGLRAGEYLLPAAISPGALLDLLESGRTVQHRLTVAEGLTVPMVLRLVAAHPALEGELPSVPPAEGSLLPETYQFERGDTRAALIERMRADMARELDRLWRTRAPDLPIETPEQALILASIIEKETSVPAEYPVLASVFVNRLRKGMLLQTDPSVIYAITKGDQELGRALTRRDLEVDDPYNTYRYPGLPPGPIANPGRGALAAALNPAATPYLYFVADGTGGHAFATTLEEHNRNVARWRRIRDAAGP